MPLRHAVFLALAAGLLAPATAYACACCADDGHWSERSTPLHALERDELARVRLGPAARTFVSPAGLQGVRGIASPSVRYAVSGSTRFESWSLRFRDARGRTGTLRLFLPGRATLLAADVRDGRRAGAGGPLLYKEWRLAGRVTGTGIFRAGLTGRPRFRLILQGRGVLCTTAEDFAHWTLQVTGPRARFSLFGSLRPPARA